jgi:hypothetical protein
VVEEVATEGTRRWEFDVVRPEAATCLTPEDFLVMSMLLRVELFEDGSTSMGEPPKLNATAPKPTAPGPAVSDAAKAAASEGNPVFRMMGS